MADVRWANLGWLMIWSAALPAAGCSSSSDNSCPAGVTPDASAPDMRPRTDAATTVPVPGADAPATAAGSLGSTCAAATDCQAGLTCLTPTDNVGPGAGVPNGLCTRECLVAADANSCRALGGNCVSFGGTGTKTLCMESCTTGETRTVKCHNRLDEVCVGLVNSTTGAPAFDACTPRCADDLDCGSRKCDLGSGFCVDTPSKGLPPGSGCTMDEDCQGGFCANVRAPDAGTPIGVCFSSCRFGQLEGCGYRIGPISPGVAACAIPVDDNGSDGDEGFCFALCDSDADCVLKAPGWGCFNDPQVRQIWGHGLCANIGDGSSAAPDAGRQAAPVTDAGRDGLAITVEAAAPSDGSVLPEASATLDAGTQ